MKCTNIFAIVTIVSLFTACGSSYDDYYYEADDLAAEFYEELTDEELAELENYQTVALASNSTDRQPKKVGGARFTANGKVKMRPLKDTNTGQVTAYAPLPANWKLGSIWEGPGGVKVEVRQGGSATAQQRPLRSVDQLVQQTFLPELRKNNAQIDNVMDLPGIARNNHKNYSRYWQVMPTQVTHQVKGIELSDPKNGKKALLIIHLIISQSQYGSMNNYYFNAMEADAAHYPAAKRTLIYALENMKLDDRAVAAHNQREQQKSSASWAAHNQKMRRNQTNFNSWQKTQNTLSEVNDIYYEGWKNRSAINDAGHSNTINGGVWGRDAAVNPYSGQNTYLEGGYNQYYMNQFGEYYGTNDAFHNPERTPGLNHQEWRKAQGPNRGY